MPDPADDSAQHSAAAAFERELARVAKLHAERSTDPELDHALRRVSRWQGRRLRATYADLAAQPRYADAIEFFQSDLYGSADFAQRDADLVRAAPSMSRMLPERVVATVAKAVELNGLSQELDRALLRELPRHDGAFSVAEYCAAYRAMGQRNDRERQIALVSEFGLAIDVYVRKPLIRTALMMMRKPAHAIGLGALQDFLEHGFHAFRAMGGAGEFLATIDSRERALMNAIFAGDSAPFADPFAKT